MEKTFYYARVSSSGQNLDRQIKALMDYGAKEQNIIVDKASGKDFERPNYKLLKQSLLRSGDTLVVKEFDRLGRNKQAIKEELQWFKDNGIRLKILDVPSTLVEYGEQNWVVELINTLLIEIMSSLAEQERIKIHQRQAEGIAVAKEKGVIFGRPAVEKPASYEAVMSKVMAGEMTAVKAMQVLGLKRTSFYKLKKLYPIEVGGTVQNEGC